MNKFIYYILLFCSTVFISCKKTDNNKNIASVIGTWKASHYRYDETGIGIIDIITLENYELNDEFEFKANGTGQVTRSGDIVATFKYVFTNQGTNKQSITFNDFNLSGPDSVDSFLQYIGNYNYTIFAFNSQELNFSRQLNTDINGQTDSKEFIYEFTKR